MKPDKWAVRWRNQLVGWIESPKVDMFHIYGRWENADTPETSEFLGALRQAVDQDDGLDVVLADDLGGTIYVHPDDDDGEIDVRWSPSPTPPTNT